LDKKKKIEKQSTKEHISVKGVNAGRDDVKLLIKRIKRWPLILFQVRLLGRLIQLWLWIMEIVSVGKVVNKVHCQFPLLKRESL